MGVDKCACFMQTYMFIIIALSLYKLCSLVAVVALKGNLHVQSLDAMQIISSTPSSSTAFISHLFSYRSMFVACPGVSVANYLVWSAFSKREEGSLHQLCTWRGSGI